MSPFPFIKKFLPTLAQKIRRSVPFDWGSFRRLTPISSVFGLDRGLPIDRYYIEKFLDSYQADIRGTVLEIGDNIYTRRFGSSRVVHSEVLHAAPGNPEATIIGDLVTGEGISDKSFDCIVLTQTLLCIYDYKAAIRTCYNSLKPRGVLLGTVPGISQISRFDMERWGDYWRFTDLSMKKICSEFFGPANVSVKSWGNVLTATAFLQGLSVEELTNAELDYHDPDYQVTITFKAVKNPNIGEVP